ncbi:MAG TPA: hypothetical protein VGK73_17280 [Polyangiaceae bacterium]
MNARRWLAGAAVLAASAFGAGVAEPQVLSRPATARDVEDAIVEIDLERARKLLDRASAEATRLAIERARLSIYLGECDSAAAQLSAPTLAETKEGASLGSLARTCARATAAGFIVEDTARGIWMRLQDDADRVLAPFIMDSAARARDAVGADLGVDLPRPLRIDLVRDQFSLSAVSGLPVTAAETTGTLAVARWGRVILLSPRAAADGYPWQDTLAHEITHLLVTRATRDRAPLWLQEGTAKREESRWRPGRPFDDPNWADVTARAALLTGRSIGIDQLGPSIAMLPTPEAATIAFAEVSSFVKYWIAESGRPALELLFLDLKGTAAEDADPALRSVSGYTLSEWNLRWQKDLRETPQDARVERERLPHPRDQRALARRVALGDLLSDRGHTQAALRQYRAALAAAPAEANVRWRAARTEILAGENAAKGGGASVETLGAEAELRGAHAGWLALHGHALAKAGRVPEAQAALEHALALDPLAEDVACEGEVRPPGGTAPLPADPAKRALCASVRKPPE